MFDRIEQELLARMVSEMNQPASDPTTLIRPQATPESTTGSEPEDDDADMLGEFFSYLWEGVRLVSRLSPCSFSVFPLILILSVHSLKYNH